MEQKHIDYLKSISKEEVYDRMFKFCNEHTVGMPKNLIEYFNSEVIEELVNEKKLITHSLLGNYFYTITDENGESIYKKNW